MLNNPTRLAFAIALLLTASHASATSSDGILGDGALLPEATLDEELDFDPEPRPESSTAYLFVAGSALNSRDSSATVTYPGAGCSTTSGALTTDLQLPEGSTLVGVRTYYYDNAASGDVMTFVTRYDGLGNFTDLLVNTLPHASGYANSYTALSSPEVINNANYAYVLTVNTGTGTRICGLRVFYQVP